MPLCDVAFAFGRLFRRLLICRNTYLVFDKYGISSSFSLACAHFLSRLTPENDNLPKVTTIL